MKSFQTKTRVISLFLAFVMVLAGSLIATAAPALAKTLTVGTASGEYKPLPATPVEVTVPITIDDPSGVGGIAFTLTYNPLVFQFKGLEQVTAGATISDGSAYEVPNQVLGEPTYYNPYVKEAPYADAVYDLAPTSTLFFQSNDVDQAVGGGKAGRIMVAAATATPLPGTTAKVLFNARFAIIGGVNGTAYPVKLFQSIINNPAAGYSVDTFLPVLVGAGTPDPTSGMYTSLEFPPIAAQLVNGSITVTAPTYSIGGKVIFDDTKANAVGSTVILQKRTATGAYVFNAQTTAGTNGTYNFAGKAADTYKLIVTPTDPLYNGYESSSIDVTGNVTYPDIALMPRQPLKIGGTINSAIPGLLVKVVVFDSSNVRGATAGLYTVGANGSWTSALLPALANGSRYVWFIQYGKLELGPYEDQAAQAFSATLYSISGNVGNLPSGGVITVASVAQKLMKTSPAETNGDFNVGNLLPGNDYIVSVAANGVPVTYYSGTTDVASAAAVDISSGNKTGINFSVPTSDADIKGKITTGGTDPVSGVTVYGFEVNTYALVQSVTLVDGSYDLKVKAGTSQSPASYEVFVIKKNGKIFYYNSSGTPTQLESQATTIPVTSAQSINNINIDVTEFDKALTGKVSTSGGDPVANALITVSSVTTRAIALTGQDGTYTVTGLASGAYKVEMKPLTGNYAAQTVSATIGSGTNTQDFTINTGVMLSGMITSSDGVVSGATIMLKDKLTGSLVGGRIYFSDSTGAYSIRDIKSGSYMLEITHPVYQSYTGNLDIGSADVDWPVTMSKGAYYYGAVKDGNGASLVGVTIIITATDGTETLYTVTNSAGNYSVYGLKTDSYIIFAQKRGYAKQFKVLISPPSTQGTQVPDFTLAPPANPRKLSGYVRTDSAGNLAGVADATVVVTSKSKNFATTATTDQTGYYEVNGLLDSNPADYRVVVIPAANLPVQSATITAVSGDITDQNFTIPIGFTLSGQISNAPTNTNVYVFIYQGANFVGFTTAATSGAFSFDVSTAGDYKIIVAAPGVAPKTVDPVTTGVPVSVTL